MWLCDAMIYLHYGILMYDCSSIFKKVIEDKIVCYNVILCSDPRRGFCQVGLLNILHFDIAIQSNT